MTLTINLPIAPEVLAALGVTDADHPNENPYFIEISVPLYGQNDVQSKKL